MSANWVRGVEALHLYSPSKPYKHILLSFAPFEIRLYVGNEQVTRCPLMASWSREQQLLVDSFGLFTKEQLFALRDELLNLKLAPYRVHASLDPLFQSLKQGPLEERRHRCRSCGHSWEAIVRASSGQRVSSVCNKCGSGGILIGTQPEMEEEVDGEADDMAATFLLQAISDEIEADPSPSRASSGRISARFAVG